MSRSILTIIAAAFLLLSLFASPTSALQYQGRKSGPVLHTDPREGATPPGPADPVKVRRRRLTSKSRREPPTAAPTPEAPTPCNKYTQEGCEPDEFCKNGDSTCAPKKANGEPCAVWPWNGAIAHEKCASGNCVNSVCAP